MGFFDQIPILSQLESLGRVVCGDSEGALKCQENFLAKCPVVSQVGSTVYAACGNNDKALELQLEFAQAMEDVVASTPVVGYVGAGISALCNDNERTAKYLASCNKSTAILAVGAASIATGGVAGTALAAGAGIAAGIGMDVANNEMRYGMTGVRSDEGFVSAVQAIHQKRLDGKCITEDCCGSAFGLVADGLGGIGGRGVGRMASLELKKNSAVKKSVKEHTSSTPSCSKKVVRQNLDDCIESAKKNQDFLAHEKARNGPAPVQCNMTGETGIKGSGMSKEGRKAANQDTKNKINKAIKEEKNGALEQANQRNKRMEGENKEAARAGQPQPHSQDALKQSQRDITNVRKKLDNLGKELSEVNKDHKELSRHQPGEHRNKLACGEHQAAETIYKAGDRPATSSATRINGRGRVYGAERCGTSRAGGANPLVPGCDQYNLGPVPTDYLHSQKLNPGLKKAAGVLALMTEIGGPDTEQTSNAS